MSQGACDTNFEEVVSLDSDGCCEVMDIEVDGVHCFFANGVLVHNCHRHAYHLKTVTHVVDWFLSNPQSRMSGCTATPQRGDGVSIGHKMFPGVSLDLPLYSRDGPSAVELGYAVPYRHKYVKVKGVDFTAMKRCGDDFDPAELDKAMNEEKILASLCQPCLDLLGTRRSLWYTVSVDMAIKVAAWINERQPGNAQAVHGTIPYDKRKAIYRGHKDDEFQHLVACSLCREGYNDPSISAIANLRPVSRKAYGLLEQMMGRACRPIAACIAGLSVAEDRRQAIAKSAKPDAMVIHVAGTRGLKDCASAADIYAEGLADVVIERANEIALTGGVEFDVVACIERAEEEIAKERETQKRLSEERVREDTARRAKLGAHVTYTAYDDLRPISQESRLPHEATPKQIAYLRSLGIDLSGCTVRKKQFGRILKMVSEGCSLAEIKAKNAGMKNAQAVGAKRLQLSYLREHNIEASPSLSVAKAQRLIERHQQTGHKRDIEFIEQMECRMNACTSSAELQAVGTYIRKQWQSPDTAVHEAEITLLYGHYRIRAREIHERNRRF